ncbi:MAG TPA: RIP metalloprotease RseP [Bacilli bacterium]
MFTPQVIFLTVLVFFLLVGIHEFGHFYFAKRANILAREFAIGFGPKLFSFKRGETRYTLRLLPLGGFVRMAGEDPEVVQVQPGHRVALELKDGQVTKIYLDRLDTRANAIIGVVDRLDLERELTITLGEQDASRTFPVHPQAEIVGNGMETQIAPIDRQFPYKTVGQRAMTIFAGPMMNFVLAFLLFIAFTLLTGIPEHIQIGGVMKGSAAEAAHLQPGDIVLSVNHETIGADYEKFTGLIAQSANQAMIWQIRRGGQTQTVEVTPRLMDGQVLAGVNISFQSRRATLAETISEAGKSMAFFTGEIFNGLKKLVTLQVKMDDLGGMVRMAQVTGQIASQGFASLVKWTALLSLYLGIFNLLPFPALDGSRLVFIGLEGLRGKPIDPAKESMVHFIGFAMLMLLMIVVTYNDILRLFKG